MAILKMAIFIDLKVATNGNYVLHDQSCQKWQSLLASKLPKMATTCFMTKVAKNGNKWLHVIAKNGNKQIDLQLYRELNSLFCHFWQYFGFSSVIMLSKNCQKRQFLLTSKLPKMANEHTWTEVVRVCVSLCRAWRVLVSDSGNYTLGTPSTPLPKTPRSPMTVGHSTLYLLPLV